MDSRVAVMGIVIEDVNSVEKFNNLLHEYGKYIIGRMGVPYRERQVNLISLFVDAPQDIISTLAGKIGNIDGVSIKTAMSNIQNRS